MDARLNDEQVSIQKAAEKYIKGEGGIELARRRMNGEKEVIVEVWDDLAGLDYTAINIPVKYGGLGGDMLQLAAFLEVAGRYALPGPFPESLSVVVPLLCELGDENQKDNYLPAIAEGDLKASFAIYDEISEDIPDAIKLSANVHEKGFYLDGTKKLVPYGGEVDAVVVAARTRKMRGYTGISLFIVESDKIEAIPRQTLDQTRPMYDLKFDDVELDDEALLGPLHGAGSTLEHTLDYFTVAITAMLVGSAERAVELSISHGKNREQYGKPIGHFQAVKHRIVDMWIDMQSARSLVYRAAWSFDNQKSDAPYFTALLKAFASDRLARIFGDDIKNHGGMGFTWDYDSHIYLKQAKAWRNFLTSPENYEDVIIENRISNSYID